MSLSDHISCVRMERVGKKRQISGDKVRRSTQLFAACIYNITFPIFKTMHRYETNAKERDTGNAGQQHICGTLVTWQTK